MPTLIVDGPEKASTRTLSKNVPDYGGQVRTASSLPGSPDRRGAVLDPNHPRNSLTYPPNRRRGRVASSSSVPPRARSTQPT
jgi:hypothetical protein